jgi:hypothetical protein
MESLILSLRLLARQLAAHKYADTSIQVTLLDFILAFWLQAADLLAIEDNVQEVSRALAARLFAVEQARQPYDSDDSDDAPAKVRSYAHALYMQVIALAVGMRMPQTMCCNS